MTHFYIKLCDICGRPAEMDSMLHAGTINADVMINNMSVYRENFDICAICLKESGLDVILIQMKKQKEKNKFNKNKAQKLLKLEQGYLKRV